jgi:hypothetical protein
LTVTEEQYNQISEEVYWLEPKHDNHDATYKVNATKTFSGQEYKILKIQENSDSDGMQAMLLKSFSK